MAGTGIFCANPRLDQVSSLFVRRRKASRYFADVFSITSFGRRGAGAFVPFERLQIIAHKLFIEAGRALSDNVLIFWPETRRVRCETFVDQEQISSTVPNSNFVSATMIPADRRDRGRANKFPGLASSRDLRRLHQESERTVSCRCSHHDLLLLSSPG